MTSCSYWHLSVVCVVMKNTAMIAKLTKPPGNVYVALWYSFTLHCSPMAIYMGKQCTETVHVHD